LLDFESKVAGLRSASGKRFVIQPSSASVYSSRIGCMFNLFRSGPERTCDLPVSAAAERSALLQAGPRNSGAPVTHYKEI